MVIDKAEGYTLENAHKTAALSGIYTSSKVGLETTLTYIIDNFSEMASV